VPGVSGDHLKLWPNQLVANFALDAPVNPFKKTVVYITGDAISNQQEKKGK
jgi:hypothetical protein